MRWTVLLAIALTGCTSLREVGRAPAMAPVEIAHPAPLLPPVPLSHAPLGSLWRANGLYTGERARRPGDLLTITVSIDDDASFRNATDRSRDNASSRSLSGAVTLNGGLLEPNGEGEIAFGGRTDHSGTGRTQRAERVSLRVAAQVVAVVPGGALHVRGTQEVRVNQELRRLVVEGLVRPRDIGPRNVVPYDRLASARISYGGRGRLTEVQQPPWGQQIVDLGSPL